MTHLHGVFLNRFLAKPKSVGALLPSSRHLGRQMAKAVTELPAVESVVEIGAGTGSITRHLQPFNPVVVEIEEAFALLLRQRFPQLDIRHGCGLQFLQSLEQSIGLVISVPLINNPLRDRFIESIRQGHESGHIKWCVIFTYGLSNPLEGTGFACSRRRKWVVANVPPAHVWVYY
ncbi:class I SAM-dependent methyltransferase [Orrella marina]|uniref:class I SAM-dependent methyltransferase n=1 Tax=Orrella marina TaxID=2163011 RepID=UPI00131F0AC1|nr:hypothetical protein [Orrella marina]